MTGDSTTMNPPHWVPVESVNRQSPQAFALPSALSSSLQAAAPAGVSPPSAVPPAKHVPTAVFSAAVQGSGVV
jgi:hypothetical protein